MSDIQIITNANGSGDWFILKHNGIAIYSGHRPNTVDLLEILASIGHDVTRLDLTDDELNSGVY